MASIGSGKIVEGSKLNNQIIKDVAYEYVPIIMLKYCLRI